MADRSLSVRRLLATTSAFVTLGLSIAPFAFGYQQEVRAAASKLGDRLMQAGTSSIAVVDFTDLQGNVTELGRFLAEQLSLALALEGKNLQVVDRTHLKSLMQEHKLSSTGLIDPQTAQRLGKIAGVQALGTGTVTPFGESVNLSLKVLDTSTARMIAVASVDVPRTKAIEELLAREIGGTSGAPTGATKAGVSTGSAGTSAGSSRPQSVGMPQFSTDVYRLWVQSATKVGGTVTLVVVLENTEKALLSFQGFKDPPGPWRLLDENGGEWLQDGDDSGGLIFRGFGRGGGQQLPAGTKLRSQFRFAAKGSRSGTEFTLVGYEYSPKQGRQIVIEDIKVTSE